MSRRARLMAAYAAVVAVLAVAAFAAVRLARPDDDGPRWRGRALAGDRRTVEEAVVTPVRPRRPDVVATRAMGPRATAVTKGETPPLVVAEAGRPVAEGELPDEAAAEAAANRVLRELGLDPAEWTPIHGTPRRTRALRYAPRAELPIFPRGGVGFLYASFELDARGLRAFEVATVRLATRPVEIMSEREAFARVTEPGAYTDVRLVLIDDGNGLARPYWDFSGRGPGRRPVLAVLTP